MAYIYGRVIIYRMVAIHMYRAVARYIKTLSNLYFDLHSLCTVLILLP